MSDQQATPTWSDDHRSTVIAGLRRLADFLEERPDIPAPQYLREQYSVLGTEYDPVTFERIDITDAEKIAIVEDVAVALGLTPTVEADAAWFQYPVAERVTYVVHANLTGGEQA